MAQDTKKRCKWAGVDPLMLAYHDNDWGVPTYDDRELFEYLILEGAQAGLSWQTILNKRDGYRRAFDNFDIETVANYSSADVARLMSDESIVRNRLKIESSISNAKIALQIMDEYGSLSKYFWSFVGGRPKNNKVKKLKDIPATTKESDEMSKVLKKRGFKFVGSTICYAFMQAVGMVSDHEVGCYRYDEIIGLGVAKYGQ